MKMSPVKVAPTAQNKAITLTKTIPVTRGDALSEISPRMFRTFIATSNAARTVPNNPPIARCLASLAASD
jgi:hypothetical protein